MTKIYYIKTYGCQMNVSDSEKIAGWYKNRGWQLTKDIKAAYEVVINTCSVRESAENRVFGLVNNLAKLKIVNCKSKIILTGCMLRYPIADLRKKMPAVDEFKKITEFSGKEPIRDSKIHAWVPIMEGCNNFCSYCVVPYARGREKSRPFEEIVCEVEELVNRGYKEITLLGQNVNSFDGGANHGPERSPAQRGVVEGDAKKFKPGFANLLNRLNEIEGLKNISFMTSNPWDLTDDIIEAMKLPKIDRYLHLAVQSGDDETLRKMNRKYTTKQFIDLVKKIRKAIPDIKIGTDIIVGFPGETEEQFQHSVDLCKKIGFVKAYVSIYSPRPQTTAFKLKDNVPHKEKRRRWRILEELINKKAYKI